MDALEPNPELEERAREIVRVRGGEARHVLFSGNPSVPGCPLVYGWVLSRMSTTEEERVQLRDLGFRSSGGKWTRPDLTRVLRKDRDFTREEMEKAIGCLLFLVVGSGCSFFQSRKFAGGTCAQENGRGFDCSKCAARAFLRSVGVDPEERRGR
jgi:hypothetical protein